jgi:hypothetical protein
MVHEFYTHTQHAFVLPTVCAAASCGIAVTAVRTARDSTAVLIAVGLLASALLLAAAYTFHALTVSTDDVGIRVSFAGKRLAPKRTLGWSEVAYATRVKNGCGHGWGMHALARGWLWNIAGFDAVELELKTGRVFRIGTDDPEGLLAACNAHLHAKC